MVKLLSFPILESAWERGRFSSCQAWSGLVLDVGGAERMTEDHSGAGDIGYYGAAVIVFVRTGLPQPGAPSLDI